MIQTKQMLAKLPVVLPAVLGGAVLFLGAAPAQTTAPNQAYLQPAAVDFARDVEPLLKERCYVCHGPQQQMNGLRLDRREDALRGSYSGVVIVPGNSGESKLIRLVAGGEKGIVMPLGGTRLADKEVELLRAWIDQGAPWQTEGNRASKVPQAKAINTPEGTSHWSFLRPSKAALPKVANGSWIRNPIDTFVLARLEFEGIEPAAEAPQSLLIRRLSLDLTGLPPSPAEVAEFLTDNRPDAYDRLVDRLLESEHYGEKWARHWLDLARYADSDGYESDRVRPYAWRYRHWVVEALNRDMPFDRFTLEQIAGDLPPSATVEQKIATGFHRNTLKNREGGTKLEQSRFEETVDRTNTVGTVWLGLTVGCAQCHNHKFDPITQLDYYRLFAFFNNLDEVDLDAPLPGELGPYLRALPEYDRKRQELLAQYHVPELQPPWEARLIEAAANPGKWTDWDICFEVLPLYLDRGERILRKDPSQRTAKEAYRLSRFFLKNYSRVVTRERYEELRFKEALEQLNQLDASFPALTESQAVREYPDARMTHVHVSGQWDRQGTPVEPGVPEFLAPLKPDAKPSRLELARWLVSDENPLTARVAVNRMWQELFGQGLVATPENFGTQGAKPTHPELLDWLAVEFRERGWSMKQMHKLIVTSATYRQSSNERPAIGERDPANTLLARQTRARLPAELIRDSALAVSSLLNPAVGGASVRPPQPEGISELSYGSGTEWQESEGKDRYRRGLYIHFQRTAPYPFLVNFDAPSSNVTACRRERSNTPLQALNLLNDPVFFEASQALAATILQRSSTKSFSERLDHGFQLCLARKPKPWEQESLLGRFTQLRQELENDPLAVDALFPAQLEGIGRVEAAAWVGLSRVLLNLDEFITRE